MTPSLNKISDAISDFLALVYPETCLSCARELVKGETHLCTICVDALPRVSKEQERFVFEKLGARIPLQYASAFLTFKKQGMTQRLLHAIKYRDKPELALRLGQVYGRQLAAAQALYGWDVIVPVPLHPTRQSQRGYNQSNYLALGLSETLSIPVENVAVCRTAFGGSQTRRSRFSRWRNVSEVFSVNNPERLYGKNVLLVDDVITTGATLEACAEAILKSGCSHLSVASLATV